MKLYRGYHDRLGAHVTVNDRRLPKRLDVYNHSPFLDWGYGGASCAQLALALLADVIGERRALLWHEKYKVDVIARLGWQWQLREEDVLEWVGLQHSETGLDENGDWVPV